MAWIVVKCSKELVLAKLSLRLQWMLFFDEFFATDGFWWISLAILKSTMIENLWYDLDKSVYNQEAFNWFPILLHSLHQKTTVITIAALLSLQPLSKKLISKAILIIKPSLFWGTFRKRKRCSDLIKGFSSESKMRRGESGSQSSDTSWAVSDPQQKQEKSFNPYKLQLSSLMYSHHLQHFLYFLLLIITLGLCTWRNSSRRHNEAIMNIQRQ